MDNLIAQGGWEELSQTYYTQFFVAGGPIVWFILLPMSVMAVYFMAELCITVRRKKLLPATASSEIITVAARYGFESLTIHLGKKTDFVGRAICAVSEKTRKMHPSFSLVSQIAAESLQEQGMKLLRRVEWCNLLGAVAPMVGLFGTVWGMIDAFNQLGISAGQPRPAQLAGAISVALVTTFWGLLIAIPSLFVYGVFRSKVEGLAAEAAVEVETLLERLWEMRTMEPEKMRTEVEVRSVAEKERTQTARPVVEAVKEKAGAQKIVEAMISLPTKPQSAKPQNPQRIEMPVKR